MWFNMKVKHLMIVTLLLAILTIGAASASDDISDETLSVGRYAIIYHCPY